MPQKPFRLLAFILLSLAAGALGSLSMGDGLSWYQTLTLPSWTPPSWVFGPVWTTLYVLMGSAAYLVSRSEKPGRVFVLWFFVAHLVVNALWSITFFGLHEILLSTLVIVLLLFLIILLVAVFFRYSRTAGYLLLPYLLWVSYATTLNLGILFLN